MMTLPGAALALPLLLPVVAGLRAAGRAQALISAAPDQRVPESSHDDAGVAAVAGGGPSHPIIINVGLVGTGTRSFTYALRNLGLRAAHVGPCNVPYDFEDTGSEMSLFLESKDAVSDIPFNGAGFIQAAARHAAKHPEKIKLVATVRDKPSWIRYRLGSPESGGCFVRLSYGISCANVNRIEDWSAMYDRHIALLLTNNVTLLPLGQWGSLCEALRSFPDEVQKACWREKSSSVNDGLPRINMFTSSRDADNVPCNDYGFGSGY